MCTELYRQALANVEAWWLALQLRWRGHPHLPNSHLPARGKQANGRRNSDGGAGILDEEETNKETESFLSRFVIREKSIIRKVWNVIVALLLLYTASVFPYKLSFLDFKMASAQQNEEIKAVPEWVVFDQVIDSLFYIDLLAPFFFTFRDEQHNEVTSLPRIACRYLRSTFVVNLVASMPSDVEGWLAPLFGKSSGPRVAPLVRVVRLARLAKLVSFMADSPLWQWLQRQRGVQMFNFLIGLLGVVHLTACGWYMCGALHQDQTVTWVGRRSVYTDDGQQPLLNADSLEQWFHAMYFVLVVFTTVGFGDMSAVTVGEIVYVCGMMMMGAVVHSVVVSKMINIVTNADQENLEVIRKRELVQRFAQHVQLSQSTGQELSRWISNSKAVLEGFDSEQMRKLLMLSLPDKIMEKLHGAVFQGRLVQNKLLSSITKSKHRLPPRFPILVALLVHQVNLEQGDMVYHWADHPWSVFVVLQGIFAYVARAHASGGICEIPSASRSTTGPTRVSIVDDDDGFAPGGMTSWGAPSTLCPYMLFGMGNYFGEFEMFVPKPRVSSVRCEKKGTLLVMSKNDFLRLGDEFPHIMEHWKSGALSREGHRKACLRRLKESRDVEDFAAYSIQRHVRRLNPNLAEDPNRLDLSQLHRGLTRQGSGIEDSQPSTASDLRPLTGDDVRADVEALRREVRAGHAELRASIEAIEQLLGMGLPAASRGTEVDQMVDHLLQKDPYGS